MARATRSTVQLHEKEKDVQNSVESAPASRPKLVSKKRKRQSIADPDDQPAVKQLRGDAVVKEEGSQEPEDLEPNEDHSKLSELQNAGDVPIHSGDAQKILDILEMIDTQGLLDRVFPLPAKPSAFSSPSKSTPQTASYSFRNLLKESTHHPLCVLRSAVQHLLPISSHPRSRPSTPAAQQLRFCNLALSLLDQASFHSVVIPLDLETLFPLQEFSTDLDTHPKANDSGSAPHAASVEHESPPPRKRKYALMQHLPTGDWWTSLNYDFTWPMADGRELKDLPTGHAELAAVLDAPSTSGASTSSVPKLGSYGSKKPPGPKAKLPGPRLLSCGSFLDYGPYSSFAPTFEQDGMEVGRDALGEVIWRRELRKRAKEIERIRPGRIEDIPQQSDDVIMDNDQVVETENLPDPEDISMAHEDADDTLQGLLPPDQIQAIKAALGSLELEDAMQELLDRNTKALARLQELQLKRLTDDGGGSEVEVGSEEWETAQGILDSLTIIASLRPRSSADGSDAPPLIPPPSTLRKLHRTLPIAPSEGWYGTLPAAHITALRDDSTLRVKSGVTVPVAAPAPTAPQQATPAPPATSSYPGYTYGNYAPQYRPSQYAQYKPGQASSYYPGAYGAQTQGQTGAQATATGYYPSQYSYGASGSWYTLPAQATAAASGTNSGRGTPQPGATPSTPTNYAGFFNPPPPAAQPGRAVANTVVSAAASKTYPQSMSAATWPTPAGAGTPGGYAPPTLPSHLRTAGVVGGGSQPGTPAAGGYGYYGTYQPTTQSAAR